MVGIKDSTGITALAHAMTVEKRAIYIVDVLYTFISQP